MYTISKSFTVLFAFSFIAIKLNAGAIITTVAGNGSAGDTVTDTTSAQTIAVSKAITRSMYPPTGVAVDNQGNVDIADPYDNKIKNNPEKYEVFKNKCKIHSNNFYHKNKNLSVEI